MEDDFKNSSWYRWLKLYRDTTGKMADKKKGKK
jgi:hypothetical protein